MVIELDREYLLGHLVDSRASFGQAGAGVARAAGGAEVEAGDGEAAGGDAAVGLGGFGDEDDLVLGGFGFDQIAGAGAADFLVGREEDGDGEAGGDVGAGELPEGFEGGVDAAFHVLDAGAVDAAAIAAEG